MKAKKIVLTLSTSTESLLKALRIQGLPVDSGVVIAAVVADAGKDGREAVLFIQHVAETVDPVTRKKSGGYTRRALEFFEAGTWTQGETAEGCRIQRIESTQQAHKGYRLVENAQGEVQTHLGQAIFACESLSRADARDVFLPRDRGTGTNVAK